MTESLIAQHDVLLSDLDGVVYAGLQAIPGAPEALEQVKDRGVPLVFVTNNASRSVDQVAEHLTELGVDTTGEEVVSSAQAAGAMLSGRLEAGSRVLITGSTALAEIIHQAGFQPVSSQEDRPRAVVQGFDPGLAWKDLAEAAFTLADPEVLWVATNTDGSIPQARGIAPGNGTLVAAVGSATGRTPEVAGKPEAPIFRTAAQRVGAQRPLVVGDRLDTDILGGVRAGFATVLVLTGVDTAQTALRAPTEERPDHLIADLQGLFAPPAHPEVTRIEADDSAGESAQARCGQATARAEGDRVRITGSSVDLDAWRAACAAWWALVPQADQATDPQLEWVGQ